MQGVKIQKGDFLVYSVMDVHMNEDIYTEPEKFDPARFEIGREEDKKVYYGFLGWGTGKFDFLFHVYEQIRTSLRASSVYRNENCETRNQDRTCYGSPRISI